MALLDKLIPGGSIIEGVLSLTNKLIDHWFPDPVMAAQKKMELATLEQQGYFNELAALTSGDKGQTDINAIEAQGGGLSWRRFIGWNCGLGFSYMLVVRPFLELGMRLYTGNDTWAAPMLDTDMLMSLTVGMLGLGVQRMLEKKWGVTYSQKLQQNGQDSRP